MIEVPDWIFGVASFAIGAFGAYLGLRVGLAVLKTRYDHLDEKINDLKCRVDSDIAEIKMEVKETRQYVSRRFDEMSAFMISIRDK